MELNFLFWLFRSLIYRGAYHFIGLQFEKNFICPAEQIWLEQGIEKGLEKGLQQGQKKALSGTAVKMLKEKLPLKIISKITGFSVEEIQKLKSKKH